MLVYLYYEWRGIIYTFKTAAYCWFIWKSTGKHCWRHQTIMLESQGVCDPALVDDSLLENWTVWKICCTSSKQICIRMQCYYFLLLWWIKIIAIVIDWILLFGNLYYTIDWIEGAGWLSWEVKGKNWCVRRLKVCTHIMNSRSSHGKKKHQWLDTHLILFLLHRYGILKHNDLITDICFLSFCNIKP